MNEELIMLDLDACADYISNSTGVDRDIVISVLVAETAYMKEIGIITDVEE